MKKDESEEKKYTSAEVTEMMYSMEEIRKQQQRQDKIAGYLAIPVMLIVAAIFKLSGHANFGGAVFAGLLGAGAIVCVYYLWENREDKESRKRQPPPRRTKKEPQAAVFQSLPSGPDRIGYAATEELKKRQIKRIEQAAEQTTAQPPTPKEDAETAELKKTFRESTGQEQSTAPAEQPQPSPG